MFSREVYIQRREELKKNVSSGLLFFPGNNESPINYTANPYHFRQDSAFLYYFGLDTFNLAAVIDIDNDRTIIFGDDRPVEDMVWMGYEPTLAERADEVGIDQSAPFKSLSLFLQSALKSSQKIHFLPQYQDYNKHLIEDALGIKYQAVNNYISEELTYAVIKQRSIKTAEEIAEMEYALDISYEMNTTAMKMIKPGMYEREISGTAEGITLAHGNGVSFPIIFSVDGHILHNHYHGNVMREGQIAVFDSGAESLNHYASDITRTIPVSGKFTDIQKDIYNTVLSAQLRSIEKIKPGVKFRECHLEAARAITEGLQAVGVMKGNVEDSISNGAHALFFPHGLGHMIGLDVHDMEGLDENRVGYDNDTKRSEQFGLAALRMGKELMEGFTVTVEPGAYFIPPLIEEWKSENKNAEYINYDKVEEFMDFGGIRIEDDVLVTKDGYKVMGKPIPKTIEEVEEACQK